MRFHGLFLCLDFAVVLVKKTRHTAMKFKLNHIIIASVTLLSLLSFSALSQSKSQEYCATLPTDPTRPIETWGGYIPCGLRIKRFFGGIK